ncbi:class F sortase [Arthrobacter sp. 35/47]|uniref:class F sortase n=1 Tax=Arthrobacter sp. 35/47 TaxID=269454 RepID=UPI0005688471|nr:class F sortase [Arthrobacter sp. 35/47]
MISSPSDRRRPYFASAAVAVLLLTGCTANMPAQGQGTTAPTPTVSATAPAPAPTQTPTTPAPGTPAPAPAPEQLPVLPESNPVSFAIPAIGAGSDLLSLGLRDNGSLDVPPGDPGAPASWYNNSPTPGERGPAVLLGHVNATDGGPGVFADLRKLKAGDTINVLRKDGTTATFTVDRAEQYAKDAFPTQKVYGNTEGSELRLITCDGYDPNTGEFDDNYVVYAKLAL